MRTKVLVFEREPSVRGARRVATFEVDGRSVDHRGAAAIERAAGGGRKVVGMSHGPRGIVVYVAPRSPS